MTLLRPRRTRHTLGAVPRDPRVETLRKVPLFSGCDEKQLSFIASRVEDLEFASGRRLCEQGRSGGDFFIVLSGTAEVRRNGKTIRSLRDGDFFGEIALLEHGPRTASVVATSPLRCLVLGPSQFRDVLHQDASIAVPVMHAMAERLRATAELPND